MQKKILEHIVKKILALLAVLLLAGLTACGQSNVAAKVGEVTISQTNLQETVDLVLTERAGVDTSQMQVEIGEGLNRNQLQFYIFVAIYDAIAEDLGIKISTTELTTTRADLITRNGGPEQFNQALIGAQIASENLDKYVRLVLISDKLTQAATASGVPEADVNNQISTLITKKAEELMIEVNPRYGTWDPKGLTIVATESAGDAVTPTE
jgi:predicted kinase